MISGAIRVIGSPLLKQSVRNSSKIVRFRPPLLNDLPLPKGSWKEHYAKTQKRYNGYLIFSTIFLLVPFAILVTTDKIIWTLPHPKSMDLK